MPPHPLTNFEIHKYYQNKPELNDVYSRNNSAKIKNQEYVTTLDEFKSIGTHWIALHVNGSYKKSSYDMQYLLIVLELNIFQKKFKNL